MGDLDQCGELFEVFLVLGAFAFLRAFTYVNKKRMGRVECSVKLKMSDDGGGFQIAATVFEAGVLTLYYYSQTFCLKFSKC